MVAVPVDGEVFEPVGGGWGLGIKGFIQATSLEEPTHTPPLFFPALAPQPPVPRSLARPSDAPWFSPLGGRRRRYWLGAHAGFSRSPRAARNTGRHSDRPWRTGALSRPRCGHTTGRTSSSGPLPPHL